MTLAPASFAFPSGLLLGRWFGIVVAGLCGVAALVTGGGNPADLILASARDGLRAHAASGEVGIVEIDARSLASIDKWPWPRSIHAAIVDRLTAAGARSIAFDVDLSAASSPKEDAALAAALERAGGTVVLPTFRQTASSLSSESIDTVPIELLKSKAFLAAVNVVPDADGYLRRMPLGLATESVPRPSLAAMIAERNAQINRSFDIDYSIDPNTIPRFSVADIIAGKVPTRAIRGKRIVIGATAVELGDRYAVPRHGVIPGVVIQALAAETLMQGPLPRRWSGAIPLLLTMLVITLAARRKRRDDRVAMLVAVLVALLILPLVMQASFAITLAIAPALVALLAAAVLGATGWIVERFQHRACTDAETGLPNLTALELAAGAGQTTMVVARIEEFAAIASALGPEVTATFVQRVAGRLQFAAQTGAIYRSEDACLAWVGSETVDFDHQIAELTAIMRAPIECGRLVDASLHFGIACGPGERAKQLVSDAGLAALKAARDGQRWAQFSDADGDQANWQLTLLGEIDAAMQAGQLWNAYQPKLDVASGRIIGAEALVRWQHPQRGSIRPDVFIPVVEKAGRMRPLTLHVLRQALDDAMLWRQSGQDLGVAVNVSAGLLADHEFIELVGQTLRSHPLPPERLTIEVTETAAMASPDRAVAALESWRSLGVRISVDDYGTGQSSLGYLQKLPASELKIDMSFVRTVSSDARNAAMVRSTIALAHELGMTTVAEGVEDAECLATLAAMGCDTAQGYFIGKPIDADAFIAVLLNNLKAAA